MITITDKLYDEVAQRTRQIIDKKGFIEEVVQFDHSKESAFYSFYLCAIIYRNEFGQIKDIVPIWWEFSSVAPDKGEVLNDFSFNKIKSRIIKQ